MKVPCLIGCLLLQIAAVAGISASSDDAMAQKGARHAGVQSFLRALKFDRKLRVCNAYPYTSSLDVYDGKEKLTSKPLSYKSCGEFVRDLRVGAEIDFKVEDMSVGTFTISDLPNSDAVLLMVIYRHDTVSTAVSFESHVFSSEKAAQIAVIDTYKGAAKSELRIADTEHAQNNRSELLRYDSVVAVNPGIYKVVLQTAQTGAEKASSQLVAVDHESYVVMRCGVEAQEGQQYPQELLVYPVSNPKELGAAGPLRHPLPLALLTALLVLLRTYM